MQIRLKPKQLWRRIELARIKARAQNAREQLFWEASYRRYRKEDDEERRHWRESKQWPSMFAHNMLWMHIGMLPRDHSESLKKYEDLCNISEDWIELSHEEWSEIESWRKAPFARHPTNAEAFPELKC